MSTCNNGQEVLLVFGHHPLIWWNPEAARSTCDNCLEFCHLQERLGILKPYQSVASPSPLHVNQEVAQVVGRPRPELSSRDLQESRDIGAIPIGSVTIPSSCKSGGCPGGRLSPAWVVFVSCPRIGIRLGALCLIPSRFLSQAGFQIIPGNIDGNVQDVYNGNSPLFFLRAQIQG